MTDLPTGTVTFLFTDIEGSTRLLRQLGDRYADALAEHQRILRECFAAQGGREIDTQGDAFFVAFARAGDAVASAIDAQRALERHPWPDGTHLRVRMGLHSGEPRAAGQRYVGFGVHRAARVGAVGHGGQILLSSATRELVHDELPAEIRLHDLGSYRLKDVERPERLFQVEAEGLRRDFPPLAARRAGVPPRVLKLVAAAVALAGAAAVAFVVYAEATEAPTVGSAANPITIATTWSQEDPDRKALLEVLRAFEETTGLQTEVKPLDVSTSSEIPERLDGDPSMVALIPSPGVVADLARAGVAKPLSSLGISDGHLRRSYGKAWLDLAEVDGETYGFPAKAVSKSLLWYRPEGFRRLGLTVPETWPDVTSLVAKIRRSGETPWALAAAEGWTLTDWFENVYLATAGQWRYDALFAGRLPFDDPSVIAALRRMSAILRDRDVVGGRRGALATNFGDAVRSVVGREQRAHLYMEAGFVGSLALEYIEPTPKPGETIAAAPLPRVDGRAGSSVFAGADFVVPIADGEAVRKLLLYLSSPGAGRIWVSTGAVVSPHRLVPRSAYPNALVRAEARQLTEAEIVRFDGSDLLPQELGTELGTTLQEVYRTPARATELMETFQRAATRVFDTG